MKILVLSDSHGNVEHMVDAVELTHPDCIFHLGDGWRDAEALSRLYPAIPLEQVPGNCDVGCHETGERLLCMEGATLLLCHGHTLHVKSGLTTAMYTALERGADVLLYGHTHHAFWDVHNGSTVLNPGSIGDYCRPSYGILQIENGQCSVSVFQLPRV